MLGQRVLTPREQGARHGGTEDSCTTKRQLNLNNFPIMVNLCESHKLPFIYGEIQGREAKMLIDSGAMVTLVKKELLSNTAVRITPTNKVITGVTGDSLGVLGEARVEISINGDTYKHECIVVNDMEHDVILGYDLIHARGYVLDFSKVGEGKTSTLTASLRINKVVSIPPLSCKLLRLKPSRYLDLCREAWVKPLKLAVNGLWVE